MWKDHSNTGFFITAYGGTLVNVKLEALVRAKKAESAILIHIRDV